MDAADEFRATLQRDHPAFYTYLQERKIPADFRADPARVAEILATMKRPACRTCKTPGKGMQTCSGCGVARYCGAECQALDWDAHKPFCAVERTASRALKEQSLQGHLDE
jgi:hypothetical protein